MKRSFTEVYNEVYAKSNNKLEALKRERLLKTVIFILAIIFTIFIGFKLGKTNEGLFILLFFLVFIELIAFIIFAKKSTNSLYNRMYKANVIAEIVRGVDSNLNYSPDYGISETAYRNSKFNRYYDIFSSEDYISGKLENGISVEMSEVRTQEWRESTDSDGNTTRSLVTTFVGFYGALELPTFLLASFIICKNSKLMEFSEKRIELDSAEFEKRFDCFAMELDKIKTMELLTSDIIEKFIDFSDKALDKKGLQFKCEGNKIYFSIINTDTFEAPKIRKVMQFDELYKYYNMIDYPIQIASEFVKRMNELNMN